MNPSIRSALEPGIGETYSPCDWLRPAAVPPDHIVARIGLVSDTHAPYRLAEIPAALFNIFTGVDFVLHAGDVGDLWVLDRLSAVAPVIAVHGNDDSNASTQILPYTQLLALHNHRILLWHSHYPHWPEELASRKDPAILPKLDRIAAKGREVGASIVVFGHWHFPLVYRTSGVTVINPGALASGNEITRQLRQTAAVVFLDKFGGIHPVHIDLAHPTRPFVLDVDLTAGFPAAAEKYSATILDEALIGPVLALRDQLSRDDILLLRPAIAQIAHRCWQGETEKLTHAMMRAAIKSDTTLPKELQQRALTLLG
jgi:uncharacterized protein